MARGWPSTRAGNMMMAPSSAKTPPTAIPTSRNGRSTSNAGAGKQGRDIRRPSSARVDHNFINKAREVLIGLGRAGVADEHALRVYN